MKMQSPESRAHVSRHNGVAYFTDLFSPMTLEQFNSSGLFVTGFRRSLEPLAAHVREGDRLVCYLTRLSRWVGLLEVQGGYFIDENPRFPGDEYFVRFQTRPLIWLPVEMGIPIREPMLWKYLSFTIGHAAGGATWTGKLRNSLTHLTNCDGELIERTLRVQEREGKTYEVDEARRRLIPHINVHDKVMTVPEDEERRAKAPRESYEIQATLARIGSMMGFEIWVPRRDRPSVTQCWPEARMVDSLPFDYNEATMRTIAQVDCMWLRKRAIVRAFEVEHSTAVYSGILRMADLIALQPNLAIKLHIVAPLARREKVFQEIARPTFTMLECHPLSSICTFISYASVREIARLPHLSHMTDTVLEEYSESPEWDCAC
jgi:hypothetical protein